MLKLTEGLLKNSFIKVQPKLVQTDNLIFRCHYVATVAVLFIGVALVSSQEYIGEHIRCIYGESYLTRVVERFCFFMATFTVAKHHNRSVHNREIAHPGVGPYVAHEGEEIIRHNYYQWVPFVLFFQGLCFYLPHLIWREIEKGKMKALIDGFRQIDMINANFRRRSFDAVELHLKNRLYINRSWTVSLICCEVLNLLNLIFQIYLTDKFLSNQFVDLGPKVYWDPKGDEFNPLDVVFPKVTKCSFSKYGPSGDIQYHDILCVMALNIVNEKIYIVLWFWYIILLTLSIMVLVWRCFSFLMRKSIPFNLFVFKLTALSKINRYNLITVMRNLNFGEWMFLRYLASNMDGRLFDELLSQMATSFESGKLYPEPPPMEKSTDQKPTEEEKEKLKIPLVDY